MKLDWIYTKSHRWERLELNQFTDPSLLVQEKKGEYEHNCHFANIEDFKYWLHQMINRVRHETISGSGDCAAWRGFVQVDLMRWFNLVRQMVAVEKLFNPRENNISPGLIDRFVELVEQEILLQLNIK